MLCHYLPLMFAFFAVLVFTLFFVLLGLLSFCAVCFVFDVALAFVLLIMLFFNLLCLHTLFLLIIFLFSLIFVLCSLFVFDVVLHVLLVFAFTLVVKIGKERLQYEKAMIDTWHYIVCMSFCCIMLFVFGMKGSRTWRHTIVVFLSAAWVLFCGMGFVLLFMGFECNL